MFQTCTRLPSTPLSRFVVFLLVYMFCRHLVLLPSIPAKGRILWCSLNLWHSQGLLYQVRQRGAAWIQPLFHEVGRAHEVLDAQRKGSSEAKNRGQLISPERQVQPFSNSNNNQLRLASLSSRYHIPQEQLLPADCLPRQGHLHQTLQAICLRDMLLLSTASPQRYECDVWPPTLVLLFDQKLFGFCSIGALRKTERSLTIVGQDIQRYKDVQSDIVQEDPKVLWYCRLVDMSFESFRLSCASAW